jgi:hypothetical protein
MTDGYTVIVFIEDAELGYCDSRSDGGCFISILVGIDEG